MYAIRSYYALIAGGDESAGRVVEGQGPARLAEIVQGLAKPPGQAIGPAQRGGVAAPRRIPAPAIRITKTQQHVATPLFNIEVSTPRTPNGQAKCTWRCGP